MLTPLATTDYTDLNMLFCLTQGFMEIKCNILTEQKQGVRFDARCANVKGTILT